MVGTETNIAGMIGSGTGDTTVRFFAGNTFDNRNSAPFRVLQSGKLFATEAQFGDSATLGGQSGSTIATAVGKANSALQASDVGPSGSTTISGDRITTGVIQSDSFALNNSPADGFSSNGTKFDLANGSIVSQNFFIDTSGNATFKGTVKGNIDINSGANFTGTIPVNNIGNLQTLNGTLTAAQIGVFPQFFRAETHSAIVSFTNGNPTFTGPQDHPDIYNAICF